MALWASAALLGARAVTVTRESGQRLGLVTLEQMLVALTNAMDHPCEGLRFLEVPEIRRGTFDTAAVSVTA